MVFCGLLNLLLVLRKGLEPGFRVPFSTIFHGIALETVSPVPIIDLSMILSLWMRDLVRYLQAIGNLGMFQPSRK